MLAKYGDVIETDLRFRGITLRDLFNPDNRLTIRELDNVLRGLPPESLFKTALRNDRPAGDGAAKSAPEYEAEKDPWSRVEMLLADQVDELARLIYLIENGAGMGGVKKPPKEPPPPIRRPGVNTTKQRAKQGLTPAGAEMLWRSMNPEE